MTKLTYEQLATALKYFESHEIKLPPMTCLYCDKTARHTKYMVIRGHVVVPNAYDLCDDHEHKTLTYDDIYDEHGKRKAEDLKDILR